MKQEEVVEAKKIVEEVSNENNDEEDEDESLGNMISNYVKKEITNSFSQAFESLAPMMKPSKIDKLLKKKNVRMGQFSKSSYEYMGKEVLENMIDSVDQIDGEMFDKLVEMLPVASSSIRDKIISKICEAETFDFDLCDIIPFLNSSQIRILLEAFLEKNEYDNVLDQMVSFMTFLNHENRTVLVEYLCDHSLEDAELASIFPFLSSDHKDRIINCMVENNLQEFDLVEIFPFFNAAQKKRIMNECKENVAIDEIVELLPFLNSDTIQDLVGYFLDKDEDLSELYPFLNTQIKKKLLQYYMDNNEVEKLSELFEYMK